MLRKNYTYKVLLVMYYVMLSTNISVMFSQQDGDVSVLGKFSWGEEVVTKKNLDVAIKWTNFVEIYVFYYFPREEFLEFFSYETEINIYMYKAFALRMNLNVIFRFICTKNYFLKSPYLLVSIQVTFNNKNRFSALEVALLIFSLKEK